MSDEVATDTVEIAKKNLRILQLWMALGGLVTLTVAFFVLREYFPFLKAL